MAKFGPRLLAPGVAFCLSLPLLCWPLAAEQPFLNGTPAIRYSLEKLNVLGSVLMIGAHPDDENNAVLAWCSRARKARTGYLSCTRGEGGQNLLGSEQGVLLGVLRTQELLGARSIDGASQYFTRAIDFGFTKTEAESEQKWGHDRILSDMVWVIRQQRPDVVILCFSGTPADGHGQHQASAVLGKEAFDAAADPSRFPEQLKWVKPWRASRLMRSNFRPLNQRGPGRGGPGRGGPGPGGTVASAPAPGATERRTAPVLPNEPILEIPAGDFDPVTGYSYREIATLSRNHHKSQAMVSILSYGAAPYGLALVKGEAPKHDIFDGIDVSWNRVPGGQRAGELLARAEREFDDVHPEKTIPTLLDARSLVANLAETDQWAKWKLDEIDSAIALCAGLHTEVQADGPVVTPGASEKLHITALNRSHLPIALQRVHLTGWVDEDASVKAGPLDFNKASDTQMTVKVPGSEAYSQPFWLVSPHPAYYYEISDQRLIGRADILPQLTARFDFALGEKRFSVEQPLHYRYADPSKDQFVRPVAVEPPVAIDLPAANFVFPERTPREVSIQIRALSPKQSGKARFEAPSGWKVEPASAPFQLTDAGSAQELRFRLTPPAAAGSGEFHAVARTADGTEVRTGVDVIDYSHIPAQTVFEASSGKMSAADLKVLAHKIGYVMGATDQVPEALRQMGCEVELLDEKDLNSSDLSVYDAIVTGVRAYSVRPDLRANQQRLLEYVKAGGTLIVQYNNNGDRRISPSVAFAFDHLGPYPFSFAGNNARVTDEDAPVKILKPDSPLLNVPNKITAQDFNGWVQERGLYFADKWDKNYQTPIECHDQGEHELPGGMLYTRYGKGAYVFTAYSWFRQLPAGVPGAYRIFANLLSAGKAGQ
jgi:LmbE family N-acetylglucosaminyl deacetylase